MNFIPPRQTLSSPSSSPISLKFAAMHSLASPVMQPLSFSASLTQPSRALYSRFLSSSLSRSIFPNFRNHPKFYRNFSKSPLLIKACSSITAKPSSQIRRNSTSKSEPDEKLRALRELFSKPGIGIDAYIIPSQDAHQVHISAGFSLFLCSRAWQ